MLSKRAIAIAADKRLRKRLSAGLMAAGAAVDAYAAPSEVPKAKGIDLVVVAVGGSRDKAWLDELSARVGRKTPIVAVIPTASLDDTVTLMQQRGVVSVLAADELDTVELANVGARLLFGDIFGLDKLVPWGVRVHAVMVGDYEEKTVAIKEISQFAERVGVRRKYRELIEQCLDEMLMNALYDAPVDDEGKPTFRSVPVKERLAERAEEKAVVEYACDGKTFAMSVRDAYGTLERDTVLWYLDKCLHAAEQIDRKEGGAGLGLYLIANSSTRFFVNLQPGVATEAACLFDLTAPKLQLEGFGIFEETHEAATADAARDADAVAGSVAAAPRGLLAALVTSVLLILVLIGMVAYPKLAPTPRGDVRATTDPEGAVIEIDGRVAGDTGEGPVLVPELEAGTRYVIAARKDGFREALGIVTPREDGVEEIHLVLEREGTKVLFETDPSGADVLVGGELRGRTPLELELLAGTEHEVRLERDGYLPVSETVQVPVDGSEHRVSAPLELAPGSAAVAVDSEPPGAQVRINGEILEGQKTPIGDHVLASGERYQIEVFRDGYAPVLREITLEEGAREQIEVELEPGARLSVAVNLPGVRVVVPDVPQCRGVGGLRCAIPSGEHRVRVISDDPFLRDGVDVTVGTEDVSESLYLGVVEVTSEDHALELRGAPPGTRRAALRAGTRTLTMVDTESGETREKTVQVTPGETVSLAWD